jgi:hypothetical protein
MRIFAQGSITADPVPLTLDFFSGNGRPSPLYRAFPTILKAQLIVEIRIGI